MEVSYGKIKIYNLSHIKLVNVEWKLIFIPYLDS